MSFAEMAQVAYYEAMGAAIVIPTAWPAVGIIYLAESDPEQLWKAAQGCFDTASEIEKAQNKVKELVNQLPKESWSGDDRDAFDGRIIEYVDQLNFFYVLAMTMGIVLFIMAALIAAFIIMMCLIAVFLAMLAAAILLMYASVVGAPEAAELQAQANIYGTGCSEALDTASGWLTMASDGLTALLGAMLVVDVAGQPFFGNTSTLSDLTQATLHSSGLMIKGTLQYVERKLMAGGIGGKSVQLFFRNNLLGKSLTNGIGWDLAIPETGQLPGRMLGTLAGFDATKKGDTIFSSNVPSSWSDPASKDGYGNSYVDQTEPHR